MSGDNQDREQLKQARHMLQSVLHLLDREGELVAAAQLAQVIEILDARLDELS